MTRFGLSSILGLVFGFFSGSFSRWLFGTVIVSFLVPVFGSDIGSVFSSFFCCFLLFVHARIASIRSFRRGNPLDSSAHKLTCIVCSPFERSKALSSSSLRVSGGLSSFLAMFFTTAWTNASLPLKPSICSSREVGIKGGAYCRSADKAKPRRNARDMRLTSPCLPVTDESTRGYLRVISHKPARCDLGNR